MQRPRGDTRLLRAELARVVGAGHVLAQTPDGRLSPYDHDATLSRGLSARAELVVRPGSTAEVAAVLALCYERDVPIVPRGGGTGLAGGAVAIRGEVVCSLERMRAIRELEPGLWRIHPEAGVTTRHVQRLARENGLCFPPTPGRGSSRRSGATWRPTRGARTPSSTASPATG